MSNLLFYFTQQRLLRILLILLEIHMDIHLAALQYTVLDKKNLNSMEHLTFNVLVKQQNYEKVLDNILQPNSFIFKTFIDKEFRKSSLLCKNIEKNKNNPVK